MTLVVAAMSQKGVQEVVTDVFIIRDPSSEAAWSPIVSVPFIFPPNSVKIILPIPAYTASRKLLTFSGMVTNDPHYP